MKKQIRQYYKGDILNLKSGEIFVFGSNTHGRHGKGAAKIALELFGAREGQARGLQGQSYAICTKDLTKIKHPSIPSKNIRSEILDLYSFARKNVKLKFYISYKANSVNLNGYTPEEMAEMFAFWDFIGIPDNIIFEEEFGKMVEQKN